MGAGHTPTRLPGGLARIASRVMASSSSFEYRNNDSARPWVEATSVISPVTADAALAEEKRHRLDRLYQRLATDLDALWREVGLRSAA